jgi:FkbM family methyltransferase
METVNQSKLGVYDKIAKKILRKVRLYLNLPLEHRYDKFSILLPSNHLLPTYQRLYPNYDRFLPHLAKYISPSDTIVDVGANVGDTLAGMIAQNSRASYVCIEPDTSFFRFLEKNIERMKDRLDGLKIEAIQALVGKSISNVSLTGQGGTKHAVVCTEQGIKSRPLDEIILSTLKIRLLKSDVDGFDYDVIDSSMAAIKKYSPIIFFECQLDNIDQKNRYTETLQSLEAAGYCDWTIFDNFGEVVLRTSAISVVIQLMNYIWQQNIGMATRTIFYFDILSVQKLDTTLIDNVLEAYQACLS